MIRRYITWNKDMCTGCLSCMIVCSEIHFGESSQQLARIQIQKDDLSGQVQSRYCRQCKKAQCAEVCPVGAITFDSGLGAWRMDMSLCTLCGECVKACPFDALRMIGEKTLKCDLCSGKAYCKRVCPTGAIVVVRR